MIIKELKLLNFRNYDKFEIFFKPNLNIIVGPNGIGKTNIIESIYMLCLTNSFASSLNKHTIRYNCLFNNIQGSFIKNEKEIKLEYILSNYGKTLKVNGIQKKKLVNLFL